MKEMGQVSEEDVKGHPFINMLLRNVDIVNKLEQYNTAMGGEGTESETENYQELIEQNLANIQDLVLEEKKKKRGICGHMFKEGEEMHSCG